MLSGKFEHWVPLSLETGGRHAEAQVVLDVTSVGPVNDTPEVFSFESSDVRATGEGVYLAKGIMRRDDRERKAEALVQTPATHSPFALVTFQVDNKIFADVWSDLEARVAEPHAPDGEVRPWAWLQAPVLAAA
jgi:hypothetical protein